ncbi:uncharacterized protein LOC110708124 [Chenopodium quinoa]|uniref:uncharacterized protein LOC110708124 n=1 Tax=Chenopodium quinoa TaxID=63459 RepID=UPI000B79893C|nr:uncharacterized protein LOC110708124 [Chenopodium quinoa]
MRRSLFLHVVDRVQQRDPWFQQKYDAVGKPGFSPLQKCTAALRFLAYGVAADQIYEYVKISEKSSLNALCKFVDAIIVEFQDVYLRKPNQDYLQRLLHIREVRGFPGMLGSIDCMHWEWKNCPTAWQGQFQGRDGKATIILEAVASVDLWIWHAFFRVLSSSNDINVLNHSPIFNDIFEGRAPPVNFEVNGHQYNMGYYLADGIYPEWATFVQAYRLPQDIARPVHGVKLLRGPVSADSSFCVSGLQATLLRNFGIVGPGLAFDGALSLFNWIVETDLMSNPSEIAAPNS